MTGAQSRVAFEALDGKTIRATAHDDEYIAISFDDGSYCILNASHYRDGDGDVKEISWQDMGTPETAIQAGIITRELWEKHLLEKRMAYKEAAEADKRARLARIAAVKALQDATLVDGL